MTRRLAPPLLRLLLVAAALLALLPLARLGLAWADYQRVIGRPLDVTPPRGFDGVRWEDDGAIVAAYVLRGGPGYRAGIRAGDRLATLDYGQVFTAADVRVGIERATGTVQTYGLTRGRRSVQADVPITRDPSFLYPLTGRLWAASAWGFALAALVHLLALLTVIPLARRAPRARRVAVLIGAGLVWVGGNLVRIAWVTVAVPGPGASAARVLFDGLTLAALGGWLAFPYLLLRGDLLSDAPVRAARRRVRHALAVPPVLLGVGVAVATVRGHVGPLPPDAFVAPIVFYVCVYVGAAVLLGLVRPSDARRVAWLRAGYAAVGALAVSGALFALRIEPSLSVEGEVPAGWFLTALQLFTALPVVLVSLSTLRFGEFDIVLARGAAYAAALAAVFVVVVGAQAVLDATLPDRAGPLALALLVVALLAAVQGLAPVAARWRAATWNAPRTAALARLDRFGERVRAVMDAGALVQEAATTVGDAFAPRSAAVFLRMPSETGEAWVRAAYRPEPPFFDEAELERVWDRLRRDGGVWSRNDELDEARLPRADADRLRAFGVALAVPVTDERTEARGLIVLGRPTRRFGVYTTGDVERLRGLAGQLALAAERLRLVERERVLVRQTAEAELVALRAQINPHFLFNALNTVAALIAEQPEAAEQTVESLAGLFRDVLSASGRALVPLSDELRLVRRYLQVEEARFGASLRVELDVPSELLSADVPAFAVQTLVENAVKHGIERKRGGGTVRLDVRCQDGQLHVRVADTGVGIPSLFRLQTPHGADPPEAPADARAVYGDGLTNVSRRLERLYDRGASLRLASSPDGTLAHLTIPTDPCPSAP